MEESLSEKIHKYNQQFEKYDWFNDTEKLETTLTYKSTGETVKLILEGRGGLNKDLRDIILFSGFEWSQGSLKRTKIEG